MKAVVIFHHRYNTMIKINKDWALKSDEYNVTLLKNKKAVGHYPDFATALKAMVDKDIQNLESLEYMVEKLNTLKAQIDEICRFSSSPGDFRTPLHTKR